MKNSTRALLFGAACCALLPLAALAENEAALVGEAWTQADLADRSYQNGRYADALREVDRALALRPDVARLHRLKVYTLQKLRRPGDARKAAQAALALGVKDEALLAEARNPVANTGPVASGPAGSAAYRKAWPIATRAYEALNSDRPQDAARLAEQALRIDPSQGPWALLWVEALERQEKWTEATEAAKQAIALGAPNRSDLEGRIQGHNRRLSNVSAGKAHRALADNHTREAVGYAREAVELAPELAPHRQLLVTALLQDKQYAAAEQAATDALEEDDENTLMLVLRAYLRQLQGEQDTATADFDAALAQDWLDEEQLRNIRLIAVDAAIAVGDKARASALLEPLPADDEAVLKRREQIGETKKPTKALTASSYRMPAMSCTIGAYGTQCELLPADAQPDAQGPANEAYAAYTRQDYPEAIRQARLAVEQEPDNPELQRLLTSTLAAGNKAEAREAEQRLGDAIAKTPDNADLLMQRGYVRQRLGQPRLAHDDFVAARRTGHAPRTVVLDEAYSLSNMGDNPAAVRKLKHAIDMDDAGTLDLDEEQRFNTRSAVAGLSREWGATLTLGYRGAQPSTTVDGAAQSSAGDSLFSTAELYWRPPQLNDQHGMLEVYGRLTNTLYDQGSSFKSNRIVDPCSGASTDFNGDSSESRSASGFPSTVGAVGVRYLLANTGFTFGLERRFFLGSGTREGTAYPGPNEDRCNMGSNLARYKLKDASGNWLAYATYGFYRGTELRTGESSWWTTSAYSQLGYISEENDATFTVDDGNGKRSKSDGTLERKQVFLSNELRFGRSYRLDSLSPKLVVFPHVVGALDWNWQDDTASNIGAGPDDISLTRDPRIWSLGAGPGVAVRYWFREDHYNAPRSYLDWSAQYRFSVGGGSKDRAEGLFMNLTLSY